MSKSQKIKVLLQNGLTPKDVEIITGFSYKYIHNISYDLKNPGVLLAVNKRWKKTHPDKIQRWKKSNRDKIRRAQKRWKKTHPEKKAKYKRTNILRHQNATKPFAKNARQPWMIHEIEYLKTHGGIKTIKEMALDLKRTHQAVQMAGHKYRIDLRGNKTGVNSNRFRTLQPTV